MLDSEDVAGEDECGCGVWLASASGSIRPGGRDAALYCPDPGDMEIRR